MMCSDDIVCGDTIMRAVLFCTILLSVLTQIPLVAAQQAAAEQSTETAICTFDDGKQITARYNPVAAGKSEGPPVGKVLVPGGSAITFFTESDLTLGSTTIPLGGYTMYILPNKKEWTMIVSKNTELVAKYDDKQDLARAPMEIGQLSTPADKLGLYFGHLGPKRCEINVDFGKTRGWVEFKQK
jgi:hypothetical protein